MNPTYYGDLGVFPLVSPTGPSFHLSSKISQHLLGILAQNFLLTFMVPRTYILNTLTITYLSDVWWSLIFLLTHRSTLTSSLCRLCQIQTTLLPTLLPMDRSCNYHGHFNVNMSFWCMCWKNECCHFWEDSLITSRFEALEIVVVVAVTACMHDEPITRV